MQWLHVRQDCEVGVSDQSTGCGSDASARYRKIQMETLCDCSIPTISSMAQLKNLAA
jgi:predicted MarR family transcription regulator